MADPTFSLAFKELEQLVDKVVDVGFMLEGTKDWDKLKSEVKELKFSEIKRFYEESLFKLESLRDELLFVKQEVTDHDNYERFKRQQEAKGKPVERLTSSGS